MCTRFSAADVVCVSEADSSSVDRHFFASKCVQSRQGIISFISSQFSAKNMRKINVGVAFSATFLNGFIINGNKHSREIALLACCFPFPYCFSALLLWCFFFLLLFSVDLCELSVWRSDIKMNKYII